MATNGLTMREVFNKLMEVQAQNALIQRDTADAINGMANNINNYNESNIKNVAKLTDLVKTKMWYVVWSCLGIASGAIGVKLAFP